MNKSLIVALIVLGAASVYLYSLESATSEVYSFEQYKREFSKHYTKEGEEQYRKNIFLRNIIKIQEHNANPKNTYTMGVNQFTDLSQAEFEAIYLTLQLPKRSYNTFESVQAVPNRDIDWTVDGKVTPVKNQGSCGSCWAFSATAALESHILIEKGETVSLSEQQLVDCSRTYGNQGCNGGWMDSAFEYAHDHGLTTTSAYPYIARDQACKIDTGSYKVKQIFDVEGGCNDLANALDKRPISVAVDATVWSPYKSGILSNCAKNVNHGVLLVGSTDAYWKIKNSWGATWGDNGYIRIAQGDTCAVCQYPSYATLE
jgi:C1A family cysteine protease